MSTSSITGSITGTRPAPTHHPRPGWRSRWAALGAAVAVTLGAGGITLVDATTTPTSVFVAVTPERVLDTRTGIGLTGPLVSPTPRDLQITGTVPTPNGNRTVVPPGATGVVLNVTVVEPTAAGFVSVRPSGTPGPPTTSNLNFTAGTIIPNAVTVALPASGQIELTYDAFSIPGPTTQILVDITGYYAPADPAGSGTAGPPGPTGPAGPPGAPAFAVEGVVHVARNGTPDGSNGAFDSVQAALDSITDASLTNPYIVKIGPGTFDGRVVATSNVTLQGSGIRDTTLTWTGGPTSPFSGGASATVDISGVSEVKISDLSISSSNSASPPPFALGIWISNASNVRLTRVTTIASGGTNESHGLFSTGSAPQLTDVRATASGGANSKAISIDGGSATLSRVEAVALSASTTNRALEVSGGASVRAEGLEARALNATGIAVVNTSSTVRLRDARLEGSLRSVSSPSGSTTRIATSEVGGRSGPNITCVGSYDADLTPIDDGACG